MTSLAADVRFAARSLARAPGFTAMAVVTLALGIGATTAIFSLVDAVILKPLPFRAPSQLVEIWGQDDKRTGMRVPGAVLDALRAEARTLQVIGTHDPTGGVMNTDEGALELRGEAVSANFVEVFGVPPVIGRGFAPEEAEPGAPAVMLVSHRFWRQQLGADPHAVGRTIYLDNAPHTVVGIMPAGFRTNFQVADLDYWTVWSGNRSRERERELGYELVGRLAGGATIDQARSEIDAIANSVGTPGWRDAGRRIGLVPLKDEVVGNRATALTLLMAAVGLLLAMACANLAQLLLARSDRRFTEFATRKALGAGTAELFRLALAESLLLALIGGVAGIAVAYWLVPVMLQLAPNEIPRLAEATVDSRVMVVALAISAISGCVFGLAPAWRLSRLSVVEAMKRAGGPGSHGLPALRSMLVIAQVTVAVTLLAVAGLVAQTFLTLLPSSPGFAVEGISTYIWGVRENQFPDAAERRRRVNDLIQRLEATPGITSAAVASAVPFGDDEPRLVPVRRPGEDTIGEFTPRAAIRAVSLRFFGQFQTPLLRGRTFVSSDGSDAPRVAVVNRTLARKLGALETIIGQAVRIGSAATAPIYEIVGVVEDSRWWGTTTAPLDEIYTPLAQDRASFGFVTVESRLDNPALTRAIKAAFHAAWPGAALPPARQAVSLHDMIRHSIAGPRFNATLVGAFSTAAAGLALTGLFALVAYSMSQRRRELAVRTALGARPAALIGASIRWAMTLAAIGAGLGLAAGAGLRRALASQLYAVETSDGMVFGSVVLLMLATAGLAAYWPASQAVRADPMTALRED